MKKGVKLLLLILLIISSIIIGWKLAANDDKSSFNTIETAIKRPLDKYTIENLSKNTTTFGMVLLGAFVAAVELPCTGGPYLAITTLLSQNFNLVAVYLLIIYNIIFVMPLLAILLLVFFGAKIYHVKQWKMRNRALMRLAIGILLVALGILLMLIANGTINLI